LAGYIVEQVSGMSFAQYVEQHIFRPLGMCSGSFRQPLEAGLIENLAPGYGVTNGVYRPDPFLAIVLLVIGILFFLFEQLVARVPEAGALLATGLLEPARPSRVRRGSA
jgi:CubicO group peptidase (beta-lactamase class C family)